MNIQWYPGHMTKAKREMEESIRLVDCVVEMLDARIPRSSRNPDIDSICGDKPRIIVLNKSDLADRAVNRVWIEYFHGTSQICIEADCTTGRGVKEIPLILKDMTAGRRQRLKSKGIVSKPVRVMVAGIPNVGKSSLINRISGRATARTGDKPGITKGKQWIKLGEGLEMLDTPGILWPKFDDQQSGLHLAFTGAIRDEIFDSVELSLKLLDEIKRIAPGGLRKRYGVDPESGDAYALLQMIALRRGCKLKGGIPDEERISKILLDEFRSGKIGGISLERPL